MYVITGATGNTGRIITPELLANGKSVRLIGRDKAKLAPLAAKGAEVFEGSLEDAAAMSRAFSGATAVYAMIPPNFAAADDFRGYQNRVGKNLIQAIRNSGVKYVVVLSSIGADVASGNGPVGGLYDFEQQLAALDNVHVLALRPGYFMENYLASIPMIKAKNIFGGAVKANVKIPTIATCDIGNYAARRLLALDFDGKSHVDIYGPRDLTMPEVATALGAAIGKPELQYVEFSYADTIEGMVGMGLPRPIAEMYIELTRALNKGLLRHRQPRGANNTLPTSIEDFAQVFSAAYNS